MIRLFRKADREEPIFLSAEMSCQIPALRLHLQNTLAAQYIRLGYAVEITGN